MATRKESLQELIANLKVAPLRVKRDKDGAVLPVEGATPNLMLPCLVKPLLYGESRNYESFGEALSDWSPEEKYRLLKEHLVFPDFDAENVEDMENNFDPWTIEDLVQAVFFFSGLGRLFISEDDGQGNARSEAEN